MHVLYISLMVLFFFNLMIIVHEYGHFLAARWRGLKIEKFGIWFGKPIFTKKFKDFDFVIGWIPAGGYVALPQMAPMTAIEGETKNEVLPPVKPLDTAIVAFAGPLFSFLLAVVFSIIVWQIGKPVSSSEMSTYVGIVPPNTPADVAGLKQGDKILEIDGNPVDRFSGFNGSIRWNIVKTENEKIQIKYLRDGQIFNTTAIPQKSEVKQWQRASLKEIGYIPSEIPVIAENYNSLKAGDSILKVNGAPVYYRTQIYDALCNKSAILTINRDGKELIIDVAGGNFEVESTFENSPAAKAGVKGIVYSINGIKVETTKDFSDIVSKADNVFLDTSTGRYELKPELINNAKKLGITWKSAPIIWDNFGKITYDHPSPVQQIKSAAVTMYQTISALTSSKSDIKLQHMSGPVGIMRLYYIMFESEYGLYFAIWFSVIFNINLAILNMVPLPVLDGGHIVLAGIQGLIGRPVPAFILNKIQTGFAFVLMAYMLYVTFFDVQDLSLLKWLK